MKTHIVYMTTSESSPKFYVGKHSTSKINDKYFGSGNWVKNCKKAGLVLRKDIIATFDSEDQAYEFEAEMVQALKFDCPDFCMNFASGGRGGRLGIRNSPEAIRLVAEKNKGRVFSQASRDAISRALTGKKLSAKHREKLSKAKLGKKLTGLALERSRNSIKKAVESTKRKIFSEKLNVVFDSIIECSVAIGFSRQFVHRSLNGKNKNQFGLRRCE